MTPAQWVSLAPFIFTVMLSIGGMVWTLSKLSFQVKVLWDFHVRRSSVEAVRSGLATMSSPIHITAAGFEAVMPFLKEFLPFYAQMLKRRLNERDMMMQFENKFGDFIMEKICIPQGVSQGACLIAIMKTCEEVTVHPERTIVKEGP